MKCANCKHPLSAHYPDGCFKSMWGGVCESRCPMFVPPKKKEGKLSARSC